MQNYGNKPFNRGFQNNNRNNSPFTDKGKENVSDWIKNGLDADCIQFTENFGKELKDLRLMTNQIRNAYGEVTRIKMNYDKTNPIQDILMLKPKLAYAAARANSKGSQSLKDVLSVAIDAVTEKGIDENTQKNRFMNLASFFEAVLAYHKVAGGK